MKSLKIIGMAILILIFEIYFRLRGGKRVAINHQNKEAVEIPIKGGKQ
jgi:hypothetical protein